MICVVERLVVLAIEITGEASQETTGVGFKCFHQTRRAYRQILQLDKPDKAVKNL